MLAGQPGELGEVLCVGKDDHEVRFRSIKAVIRHDTDEELFEVTTQYGRSVRVTGNHSLYVLDGRRAAARSAATSWPSGDRIAAPRTVRLPETAPERIDLLRELWRVPAAATQVWARGAGVEAWGRWKVRSEYADNSEMTAPRVDIPAAVREELAALRRSSGLTNMALCERGRHQAARDVLRLGEGQHRARRCRTSPRTSRPSAATSARSSDA